MLKSSKSKSKGRYIDKQTLDSTADELSMKHLIKTLKAQLAFSIREGDALRERNVGLQQEQDAWMEKLEHWMKMFEHWMEMME